MAVSTIKKISRVRKETKSVTIADGNAKLFDTEVPVISVTQANDGYLTGVPFHRLGKTYAKFVGIGNAAWQTVSNMTISAIIEYIDE